MNAGEFVISLLLKSGGFKTQVQDAQKDLDKTGDAGQQAMKKTGDAAQKAGKELEGAARKGAGGVSALIPTLGKVLGLLGGIAAVKGGVSSYLDQADALGKYSDALGVSVLDVQAWQEAVKHAGGSADQFRGSLTALNERILDAGKFAKGEMVEVFKALGVSVKDAEGKIRPATDVLLELAASADKVDKTQFAGIAKKLGLDQGTIMLLQQGRGAVEAAIKSGKEFARFTKEDTEAAAKANDAIQDMEAAFLSLAARAIAPGIPLLTGFADAMRKVAGWTKENQTFVTAFVTVLSALLLRVGIPAMLSFAKATMAAMAPLMPLVAIVTAAALAFDDLWAFITGGNSALERFALKLGVSQETIESVREALRSVVGFFLDLWDAVTGEGKNADAAWDRVKATWDHALAYFAGILARIKAWFSGLFDSVKQGLLDMIPAGLKSMLGWDDSEESAKKTAQAYQSAMDTTGVVPLAAMRGMATAGDLARGAAGTVDNSRTVSSTTSIGQITVQTQAEDAPGIARDMDGAIRNRTAQIDPAYGR